MILLFAQPSPTPLYKENRILKSSHNSFKLLPISLLFLFITPLSCDSTQYTLCIEKTKLSKDLIFISVIFFNELLFFFLYRTMFFLLLFSFVFSGLQSFSSCAQVYRVFLRVLRFKEFSFLFSGLRSFSSCSQVYVVFLLVLGFTEFSFLFSGLRSFPSCSQVYGVFLLFLRFTEFFFVFSGLRSFSSCSQVYGVFLLVLRFM